MRIYMIGQKGLPAHSGGIERHVDELATRLVEQGHQVVAYARKHYVLNANCVQDYKGIKLVYLPTIKSKYLDALIHTALATIHVLFQPVDVIHYHGIAPSFFAWIPRVFKPRAKVISTFHCQDYYHQKWGALGRAAFHVGEFVACRMTHQTIVVSKTLQRYVAKTYGRKAVYIPNGVSMHQRRPMNKIAHYGLTPKGYILSVSRLVRHKGIHHLILAYLDLKLQGAKLPKLVIVGGSSYTDTYVNEIKNLIAGHSDIVYLGEQHGAALEELYSNAALFVQPSEQEGLSIALLEAMSYGCPVLVSDIAENKEVLPSVGFTFRNKDVTDLAAKLNAILAEPAKRTAASQQNRAHIQANYNFDQLVLKAIRAYSAA